MKPADLHRFLVKMEARYRQMLSETFNGFVKDMHVPAVVRVADREMGRGTPRCMVLYVVHDRDADAMVRAALLNGGYPS